MIETGSGQIKHKALIIDENLSSRDTAAGRAACSLVDHMRNMDMAVTEAISAEDGMANIVSDMSIHAVLISSELAGTTDDEPAAVALLREMRGRHNDIRVFLMAKSSKSIENITEEVMSLTDEFIWMLEDTATFVAGRVAAAVERYARQLLPPYASALASYSRRAP